MWTRVPKKKWPSNFPIPDGQYPLRDINLPNRIAFWLLWTCSNNFILLDTTTILRNVPTYFILVPVVVANIVPCSNEHSKWCKSNSIFKDCTKYGGYICNATWFICLPVKHLSNLSRVNICPKWCYECSVHHREMFTRVTLQSFTKRKSSICANLEERRFGGSGTGKSMTIQGCRKDFWSGPAVIGKREAHAQLLNISI